MNKYKNIQDETYKSRLEKVCSELLTEAKLEYDYEPWEIVLLHPFRSKLNSFERVGKAFKNVTAVRKISYTPDFVGKGWIIETKGKKTPDFQIKWKLLKKYLEDNNLSFDLFMPTSKKEIINSIELIQKLRNEKERTSTRRKNRKRDM